MLKKSAISLISYDAEYLPDSISRYYDYVDEIILGLDKNRISWSKNTFSFDESKLWSDLAKIDGDNKITVIEENFHSSDKPMENDTQERNFLKAQCSNDWIISIDADEMLINAKEFFVNYCPIVEKYANSYDICMTWATPYKQIDDTVLIIANEDNSPFFGENQGVMTTSDSTYVYARWTDKSARGNNRLQSPLIAIHWSLCRTKESLKFKITNSSHSDLADKDPFFSIWKEVTLKNYHELHNFKTSGLGQSQWPKLMPVKAEELEGFYNSFKGAAY